MKNTITKNTNTLKIIGISGSGENLILPPAYHKLISEADVLAGGERLLGLFPEFSGEKIVIKTHLSKMADQLIQFSKEGKSVTVLASGDPLFYGVGSYLAKKTDVEIFPSLTSLQLAAARAQLSWQNSYPISLHGKPIAGLAQKINGRSEVAILTDLINTPVAIAKYLLSFKMQEYKIFVGEDLGTTKEKTNWFTIQELANTPPENFSNLNILLLKAASDSSTQKSSSTSYTYGGLGIDEEEFEARENGRGLITKKEIRVLTLSALKLHSKSVVWDIGACTGSLSIEAARIAWQGEVFSIEKNDHEIENFKKNMVKFRTDITLVHGKAPDGLENFADPDAVFIGGSGGELPSVLKIAISRLKEGGVIVVNAATLETLQAANDILINTGFKVDITLAQISRSKPILDMTRFEALNPVYIISALKQR
ncbi:MAG: precorrin-6y C5,15-methyltransferase (decarboxylating) subunit CbiE [Leptospirales bacterium]